MDVRCGGCGKLFRVPDEKIVGAGVQFKCTRCGEYVKVTRDEFEQYQQAAEPQAPPSYTIPEPQAGPEPSAGLDMEMPPAQQAASEGFDAGTPPFGTDEPVGDVAGGDQAPSLGGTEFTIEPTRYELGSEPEQEAPAVDFSTYSAGEAAGGADEGQTGPTIDLSGFDAGEAAADFSMPGAAEPSAGGEADFPFEVTPPRERGRGANHFEEAAMEVPAAPAAPAAEEDQERINPLVSGSSAGVVAGIGCALPVIAVSILGVGMLSQFVAGASADVPIYYTIGAALAKMMGLGILIGIFLAIIQSGVRFKVFSFPGVLFGALLGGVIGAGQGFAVSFGSDAAVSTAVMITLAITWAVQALLVSIAVVIIRRAVLAPRRESFSAGLSASQVLGVVLSLSILGLGVYGEVMSSGEMRAATDQAVASVRQITSPEGLRVTNLSGYIDTNRFGDLVIAGVVENTTKAEKPVWYVVADVLDSQGKVIMKARLLNGKQLYTKRDYDILAKRGTNVQELMSQTLREQGPGLPPNGMVNFEIRIMEPPAGVASFVAALQPVDIMQLFQELAEDMKKAQ